MNGMRKLLFILMVLPFTLNVRAEDPPSMLENCLLYTSDAADE